MKILGIDTSGAAAAVGIAEDGNILADLTLIHERAQSEKIMEMVDMALRLSRLSIKDIDSFAVVCGPGSFTGLRIGTACVKGLAQPENKKVFRISSADVLYEKVRAYDDLPVCVMTDAGRQEVYCALYENGRKITDDTYMDIGELSLKLKKIYKNTLFTGNGMIKYNKEIKEIYEGAVFADKSFVFPNGSSVVRAASEFGKAETPENICPIYLKKSQAERMREKNGKN